MITVSSGSTITQALISWPLAVASQGWLSIGMASGNAGDGDTDGKSAGGA